MELNWAWEIEKGNSFRTALRLCHTSSIVWAREEWWARFLSTHDQMFSMSDRSWDHVGRGKNWTPCVSKKVRIQCTKCGLALSCWKMAFGRLLRQYTTTGLKMSKTYQLEFKYMWTSAISNITDRLSTPSIANDPASTVFRHLLICISSN